MRAPLALAAACWLAALGRPAEAQEWYDPEPLLASVRPSLHGELARSAGVASLADLPLYELELDVDAERRTFALDETIWLTNREDAPLSEIVLRIYANAVPGTPPVTVESVTCVGSRACRHRAASPSALVITPAEPLAPGARVRIRLRLRAQMQLIDSSRTNTLAQGMESLASLGSGGGHGSDFGLLAVGDGIVSLANFYAVLARRENGRWIEGEASGIGDLGSDAMSHVRAVIRTAPDVRVVATGRAERARVVRGRRVTRVSAGMVRDFSALASRSFEVAERRVGDVTVRSWFLANERGAGERVLDVAAEALAVFERRFGAYPYVDLDVVEAPLVGGAGGVEFSGLVTVASMFYREASAGAGSAAGLAALLGGGAGQAQMQERMREVVVAHEVAHQWWHGLVGSDSRAHPYVDESLAQWSALLYLEERYGAARAREDADMQVKMGYQMMRLMGHADGAVDRPADAFGHPIVYAGLVYGKGPYMYPALRRAVGDRMFFAALRRYVDTYRFRQAPSRGFVDQLARGRHRQRVRAIARRWLEETHGDRDLGQLDLGPLQGLLGGGGLGASGPPGVLGGAGGSPAGAGGAGGAGALDPAAVDALRRAIDGL